MTKLKKFFSDPSYYSYVVLTRILRLKLGSTLFSSSADLRSDTENGRFLASVQKSLSNQRHFDRFKRSFAHRDVWEHVGKEEGGEYLKILQGRSDGLLNHALKSVLLSDQVGNPRKYQYGQDLPLLSPTTLRYVKVASDLQLLFGKELGDVAEIGCGYGGQALVNDHLLSVRSTSLFDLPEVNRLVDRYLNYNVLRGAFFTTTLNNEVPKPYDLVISNYAFSELPSKLQVAYTKKVLSHAKRGYLTMNSGIGGPHSHGKLTLEELRKLLPDFITLQEEPGTAEHNYIIVWGARSQELSNFVSLEL